MNSDPFGQKQLWVPIKIIEKEKKKTRNAEVPIVLNDSNFYWHYCEVAYAVDKDQEKHLERFLFVLT